MSISYINFHERIFSCTLNNFSLNVTQLLFTAIPIFSVLDFRSASVYIVWRKYAYDSQIYPTVSIVTCEWMCNMCLPTCLCRICHTGLLLQLARLLKPTDRAKENVRMRWLCEAWSTSSAGWWNHVDASIFCFSFYPRYDSLCVAVCGCVYKCVCGCVRMSIIFCALHIFIPCTSFGSFVQCFMRLHHITWRKIFI